MAKSIGLWPIPDIGKVSFHHDDGLRSVALPAIKSPAICAQAIAI